MKVIKRDGRAVDYDKSKIMTAIEKANQEVQIKQRASKDEIKEITEYIESLGKKRMLVEDIQDIIEEKLMELDKYELAKKYQVLILEDNPYGDLRFKNEFRFVKKFKNYS